jgi:hypothetical protein
MPSKQVVEGSNPFSRSIQHRGGTCFTENGHLQLLPKYVLDAKAQGMTDKSIAHVRLAVKLFAEFLGDIPDIRQVTDDDLRRFVVALQQETKWVGLPQDKGQKLSGTRGI